MGLVGNSASLMSRAKKVLIQLLSLALIVSSLSVISVVTAPAANAAATGAATNTQKTTTGGGGQTTIDCSSILATSVLTGVNAENVAFDGFSSFGQLQGTCTQLDSTGLGKSSTTGKIGIWGTSSNTPAKVLDNCPDSKPVIVGFQAFKTTGGFVSGIKLQCGTLPLGGSPAFNTGIIGVTASGNSTTHTCSTNTVAIGIDIDSGSIVDKFGIRCGPITGANQTITFTNPGTKVFGSGTFSVSPTSNSDLTVSVTSATTSICTVASATVTLVAAGTCILNANQLSGNTNYAAASQVQQSFTVSSAAALTPTFGSPTATADGFTVSITNFDPSFAFAGTATASGTVTVSGAGLVTVSGVAAGTSSTATITTTRTNYTGGSSTVTATSLSACSPTQVSSGGFTTVTFSTVTTCSWTVPNGVSTAQVLVVGGGGGGGGRHAGGGGGGGVVYATSYSISGSTVVRVGTGGTGGTSGGGTGGTSGTDSRFFQSGEASTGATGLTAKGGGFGDFYQWTSPNKFIGRAGDGGSGGGSGVSNPFTRDLGADSSLWGNTDPRGYTIQSAQTQKQLSGTTLTSNFNQYGNDGGGGGVNNYWGGGGGGGAGAVGGTSVASGNATTSGSTGGAGGVGVEVSITGSALFYGGGGGGGSWNLAGGVGGNGGGGSGTANATTAASGTANTGGGGGGGGLAPAADAGGPGGGGGSGVVILRYANATRSITYALNSGVGTAPTQAAVSEGATFVVANGSGFSRAGFTFSGWNDGSNNYNAGSTYTVGSTAITLTAQWASSVATLSALSLSTGTLSPTFASGTTTYTASVANSVDSITVTPTRTQANATIQIKIGSGSYAAVTSASPSSALALSIGSNTITVLVTAQDGTTTATYTVTVTRLTTQSITRTSTSPVSPIFGGTYTPTATASSGLTVTISIAAASSGICSISGGVVTFNAAGSCAIQYDQAGNSTYAAATQLLEVLTIGKASQTITFASLSNRTLGSGTYSISATSSSVLAVALTSATTGVCTISSGVITLVAAGSCTINADQSGNDNFLAATQVQQSFTVSSALSITTPTGTALNGDYNSAFSLSISASGGAGSKSFSATGSLPTGVTLSSAGVISGTPSTAGSFSLTVTVTDANGATATTTSFTIAIAKGVSTVSLSIPTYTFTGSGQGPDSATASGSAGAITFAYAGRGSTTYASSSTKPTNAGTYTVTVTVAADSNFASISTTANYEILAAAIAPTIGTQPIAASKTVGQSVTFTVVATASDGGVLTYQWQIGLVAIAGATSASYTFTTTSAISDAGNYLVVVTNTKNATTATTTSTAVALTMSSALTITTPTTGLSGSVGIAFTSLSISSGGGSGSNAFTVVSGTLPAGLSLSSGGAITGTPTATGDQGITVRVTDSNGATATTSSFTISIASGAALTPTFGTPTATADGFTVSITNYNAGFTFAGTATASGSVAINGSGLVTITGVAAGTSTTATIITSRTGYTGGSATVSGTVLSNIATLSALSLSTGTLSPTFASSTTTYTASVANSVSSITITPTRTQANAIISINTTTVTSGSASGNLVLSVGVNIITAVVTAQDGVTTTTYTLTVTRLATAIAPTIGTQPTAASKSVGQSVTFTVVATASDGGTLSYQWQIGLVAISGATSASYTFTTTSAISDAGNYLVVVTNTKNATTATTTSTAVALTMSSALTITNLTTGLTGTVGISFPSLTTLSAGGSGTNSFTVSSGTLPAGLSLSASGVITGTPTATGDQGITVRVTDSNGATATTSSFTISIATGAALTPTFGSTTATADGFTVSITNYSASFTFAGTATASGTLTISVAGLVTVSGVAAGTSSTATITTTRTGYMGGSATVSGTSLSNIATLSTLTISSGTLTPTFASATTTYTASVANSVSTGFTVTPTTSQVNASTVQYLGASGTTSFTGALSIGANVIRTVVTAQDAATVLTYTVTVTRLAAAIAPTIGTQPTAASKSVGQSVTFTVVATASDGGTLSYQWQIGLVAISGATSASYTIAATVAVDAGDYKVVVTNTKNATIATTTSATVALTMSKATPTFTWGNVTKSFGDATFIVTAPTVTDSLAGSFTYSSGTTTVISILGTTLTVVAAGSSIITASFTPANLIDYNITSTTMTVTVNKAAQTLTWAPTTSYATTASPVTPSVAATALGSATISYSVTNAGTTGCSVNSATGVLTFTTAGSCTVQASAGATANYESATSSVTFVISLGSRTFSIDSGSYSSTYAMVATAPTLTSTASAGAGSKSYTSTTTTVCTVISSTGVVTFVAIGSCTISATIAADSSYSSVTSSSISFTVTLATQTVSWSPTLSLLATGSPTTPSALASALGLATIIYAVQSAGSSGCTVNSATAVLSFTAPGICTVRASAAATLIYAAGSTDAVFTISAAVLSNAAAPTVTATAGVLKSFSAFWLSITNASSYTLKIYNAAGSALLETVVALLGTSKTITASEFAAIADATAYQISITAIGSGNYSSSEESTKVSVTTATTFTITYLYNGATSDSATVSSAFITGANTITLPTPSRTGYVLEGWYEASDLTGTKLSATYTPTQTRSIYAKWTANTLVVSFNSQSGTAVLNGSVATGANLAAPTAPTRDGYTFSGWATTSTGSVVSFSGGYTHGQTASFTLYAIWAANALTVTYDSKGGTAVTSGSVNTGASITSAPTAPNRTGYTFDGWSLTDGGAVVTFPLAHGKTVNFTLFAKWTGNTNTIIYNSKGGSAIANGSFVIGGSIAAAPIAPNRAGYTLSGWSLTDGGSVISYPFSPTATAGITLFAIWSGVSCSPTSTIAGGYTSYTFTTVGTCFWTVPAGLTDVEILAIAGGGGGGYAWDNAGAGGGAGGQLKTGTATLSTTLEVSVGAGGSAGTTASRRGGTGESSSVSTVIALGGTGGCSARSACSITSQATALAGANGGAGGIGGASGRGGGGSNTSTTAPTTTAGGAGTASNYSGTSVTYGLGGAGGTARGLITSTNITGTDGSVNTGNGGGGASAKSSSGDVNGGAGASGLVIVRVASGLTITFDSQSGSSVSNGSTVTGTSISTAPTDPTRSNYTFLGWFTASSGGSALTFPYLHSQTANFTLYAQWSVSTYAIVFNTNNGTGNMGNQIVTHSVAANLNTTLFSRANYVFYRWATAADGTGTTFNNLAQVTLTAGTTLYAQWTANTYVVSYNYNGADGGDSTSTASFTTAGSAITLPTPTKTGFTFAGWFSDAALSLSIGSAGVSFSPTGAALSLNAYAKWTAIDYTFTYDSNSSDSGTVPIETTKQITQTATVKANTGSLLRAGYTFSGWNTLSNGNGTNYLSGSLFTVASANVILYAKWNANTYTVTYNINGGTGSAQRSSSNVTSDSYTTGGSSVILPGAGTLARSGYTFAGWNTSAAGTGTDYLAAATYTTISDVIFYAKWSPITYTITYNGNTGSGSAPTTGGYTTGQASPYVVLTNTFTKSLNIFGGWNTAALGTGVNYSPSSSITTLENIVLYAVWIPQFTLHYAINGGSVTSGSLPSDTLYNLGFAVGPIFGSLSRTGYEFGGWSNGLATIAANGSFIILEDSVLTAKWTPINYAVSYNSDGGSAAPSSTTKQLGQSFSVGSAASKPGYNFSGWLNGSTVIGADAVVVMASANIAYTAQWIAKVYTVSYDWNGGRGTAVSDVSYTFGTTAIILPLIGDRVKDGYTFIGWSESLTGSALNATYSPSQSRSLYALWTLGNFTITYNLSGGTLVTTSVSVQNGSSTVLPLPARTNFVFDGWYTATIGGSSVGANGSSFTPTASQTVYARWIQSSLYGITNSLTRIGSVVTVANVANTFLGANSNSSVTVSVPENALPAGTTINFDMVGNSSRATGVLPTVNYLISIAISWLTGDGTVPDTAAGKPISVTISNATIKAGASAYAIVNNASTLLGSATQDGTITIILSSDPEIVIAATKPGAPINVAATSNRDQQSVLTWIAPSSNGGSAITGYNATSNTGATCSTNTTSCTVSSLLTGTAYTFTVTATNSVGTSVASSSASATTAALHVVAFDAKSGTSVTSGSFLTASTVSEPTAPTRTGFAFAGWAATDGGSAQIFPYAPGVTSNITMYARWDALDNAVTFNSNSGSSVITSVFSSGGTVTEPTAPTRSGYTFAGWSATDGGSAVIFPYSPGVVTEITLYAKWSLVSSGGSQGGGSNNNNAGGGGSSSANPRSSDQVGRGNVTMVAPVTVVGKKDAKVPTVEVVIPTLGSDLKPTTLKVSKPDEGFISEVKVVDGRLAITPETGFSGKKIVTVTITENGVDRIIQIPLSVLPETVTKPVLTPTAFNKSIIRWAESPNADAYTVYLNGKKVCATSASSCSVNQVLGPDAVIEIISNGGDRTVSQRVEADFKQITPIAITRLVSATITKSNLTTVDTRALDKVIALIKSQGFRTVQISEMTTTSKTKSLADARIASMKKYILSKLGTDKVEFEIIPVISRTYFNNISVKG